MAKDKITLSARFTNLQDAESAATELRSQLAAKVDIRALSENQSSHGFAASTYPAYFFTSSWISGTSGPYLGGVPDYQADPDLEGELYADRSYVVEARIDEHQRPEAAMIIAKYGADIV